jgi:GNAT superfamily N-acetyltransferase
MRLSYTKNKKRIKTYCNLISRYELMFKSGGISIALSNTDNIEVVGLVFNRRKIPIACCLITKDNIMYGCNISVYVKPNYRNIGIGKRILSYVTSSGDYKLNVWDYDGPSKKLYSGIGL